MRVQREIAARESAAIAISERKVVWLLRPERINRELGLRIGRSVGRRRFSPIGDQYRNPLHYRVSPVTGGTYQLYFVQAQIPVADWTRKLAGEGGIKSQWSKRLGRHVEGRSQITGCGY